MDRQGETDHGVEDVKNGDLIIKCLPSHMLYDTKPQPEVDFKHGPKKRNIMDGR